MLWRPWLHAQLTRLDKKPSGRVMLLLNGIDPEDMPDAILQLTSLYIATLRDLGLSTEQIRGSLADLALRQAAGEDRE